MRSFVYPLTPLCFVAGLVACSSEKSAAPGADCESALFCDDFEAYTGGSRPSGDWVSEVSAGTLSVDESERHSGRKSVKFSTEGTGGVKRALIRLGADRLFPFADNTFFGRMMFRLESAPETSMHWTLIQAGGLVEGQDYHALYRYGGQHPVTANGAFVGSQWMANYETPDSYGGTGPSSDCWSHANQRVIPVGRWTCVEWQFDGPNNAMKLWLDGVTLDDLSIEGKGQGCVAQPATFEWTAPNFDSLEVGWESYQPDEARTLWIDDVALDTARVGCPAR